MDMAKFSKRSIRRLETCNSRLKRIFNTVIDWYDCSILEGHRNKKKQNLAFKEGRSKLQWPDGNHNHKPSDATDAGPYPIDWGGPIVVRGKLNKKNLHALLRWHHFAGFVQGVAAEKGIKTRWGGDWNSNRIFTDQNFNDLPHFETVDKGD